MIGIDHRGSAISTDSARGPKTAGNNEHVPDKRDSGPPGPLHSKPARCPGTRQVYPQVRLANVQSGDRPADEHALDFAGALKNREDLGVHGKSHRHTRAGLMLTVLPRPTRSWVHDDEPGAGFTAGRRADAGLLLVRPTNVPAFR